MSLKLSTLTFASAATLLSEISFELANGAFNGTGDVIVDNILDNYRTVGMTVI